MFKQSNTQSALKATRVIQSFLLTGEMLHLLRRPATSPAIAPGRYAGGEISGIAKFAGFLTGLAPNARGSCNSIVGFAGFGLST